MYAGASVVAGVGSAWVHQRHLAVSPHETRQTFANVVGAAEATTTPTVSAQFEDAEVGDVPAPVAPVSRDAFADVSALATRLDGLAGATVGAGRGGAGVFRRLAVAPGEVVGAHTDVTVDVVDARGKVLAGRRRAFVNFDLAKLPHETRTAFAHKLHRVQIDARGSVHTWRRDATVKRLTVRAVESLRTGTLVFSDAVGADATVATRVDRAALVALRQHLEDAPSVAEVVDAEAPDQIPFAETLARTRDLDGEAGGASAADEGSVVIVRGVVVDGDGDEARVLTSLDGDVGDGGVGGAGVVGVAHVTRNQAR